MVKQITTVVSRRAEKALTSSDLKGFFSSVWSNKALSMPSYPDVIGGVFGWYKDSRGNQIRVKDFHELLEMYKLGKTSVIIISGGIKDEKSLDICFVYDCEKLDGRISISTSNKDEIVRCIKEFTRYFPYLPFSKLDIFLRQRGYQFEPQKERSCPIANIKELNSKHHRIAARKSLGGKYASFFEILIYEIAKKEFNMTVGLNYKIENEGPGGDYDVLALDSAQRLIYFECKTGSEISKDELRNFYKRHLFLKPALSIVVFDGKSDVIKKALVAMGEIITKKSEKSARASTEVCRYCYSEYKTIPSRQNTFAYYMDRNLFFISDKDITRGIRHSIRYLDGAISRDGY